jgi:hypothetical protein
MVLAVLTGWLDRRERQAIAYLMEGNRVIVDNADLMIRAAVDGLGLTFSFEEYLAAADRERRVGACA